ncbi:pantoate--beta-alanine ligase [Sorangium sp. So ce381]|uniref:pantoate--beta-alanine ligase n=1 Tax=Sorangium sp. So ce381 TaxID=3133307 RepID=UPI003F5C3869
MVRERGRVTRGESRSLPPCARGVRVGLVTTMGTLHAGHIALVKEALRHAPFVAVTVFVNPTQFGPNEDFARYRRTLPADAEKCEAAGAAVVFAPDLDGMYPPDDDARVRVGPTAAPLCGPHRPGHFEGVATVVAKLFALTGPAVAVFGRKDYQQLRVISRMATDLFFPVEVIGLPTVRDPDGLALSSRNAYLSPQERATALAERASTPSDLLQERRARSGAAKPRNAPVSWTSQAAAAPSARRCAATHESMGRRPERPPGMPIAMRLSRTAPMTMSRETGAPSGHRCPSVARTGVCV